MAASRQHQLNINDLRDVYTVLITLASKFRYIGLEVGVPNFILDQIDRSQYDFNDKLRCVLEYRLKQKIPLTWEDVVRALRSPAVNEPALASQIEYDYLPHSSSQSVPTPVPPVRDTSHRPGPSHQPPHQQQPLHLPSHQPFLPNLDLSFYHHLDLSSQPPSIEQNPMNLPHQNLPYNLPHHPLPYYPASQEQSTFLYPNQPSYMYPIPPALHYTPRHRLGAVQQGGTLIRTQQYGYIAPVQQHHQQQYYPHIQQPPSEHVQFSHPIIQPPTQLSYQQTPHPQLRHSSVHMQYSSNPLYSPSNDSQQSQSPQQPSSVHTVSTPPQYHSPQQVSLSREQSLSPAPLTKRPRLEPMASSRQQSVPPPSPASSTLVASHTPTPQESIQTFSLQHVQSVASSSEVSKAYSEAMKNFIHYVMNIYKSRKVETFVKFSLNPTKVYINHALIDRHVVEHKEYKDITVAMVQDDNVDVIQEKKERIELNKIASGIPNPITEGGKVDGKTLILVEGAPGVGKSTFAWEFCRRWLQGIVAPQYDLVLLLRLRDERIRTAKCLKDLLYIPLPGISEQVLQEVVMGKYNVLLILEGYDELPDSARKDSNSVFNQLISGQLLPLATILVTSRPWATEGIRKHQSRLFQHIEVLGFTKRQIKEYIKATVPAENINDLTSYLERHPQIRSGMYVPLNSAIVVAVYLASQRGTQPLPKTQTELYTSLVDILIGRHMESHPELKKSVKIQIPFLGGVSVPVEIRQHLVDLSKVAYKGIVESGDEVKLIFSEEELPPNFDNLGFMDSATDLYLNQETKSSHNFLHLTFQEFFAAAYISTMPSGEQRGYYQENIGKKGSRLNIVLKFLSGLKKLDCFTEESAMLIMQLSQHIPPCEFISPPECMIGIDVINWIFEAQSEDKISIVLGERKVKFNAEKLRMSPMDYYSLGYCISHSQCQWVLSLAGGMAISKEKIRIFAEGATRSGTGRIVKFEDNFLTKLSEETLMHLFQNRCVCLETIKSTFCYYPEDKHCYIKTLYIDSSFSLTGSHETKLLNFLSSTKDLLLLSCWRQLNYELITEALLNNNLMPLKTLIFHGIELTSLAAKFLIKYLQHKEFLNHFSLVQCEVPAQELMHVYHSVQQNLVISKSEIHECKSKVTCDEDTHNIKELLQNNVLEDDCVKILKDIIDLHNDCINFLARTSDLSYGKLRIFNRGAGFEILFRALHNNNTLEELDISYNQYDLYIHGVIALAKALQQNSTLKSLNMSNNSIGDEGTQSLAEALKHNSTLEVLNLSYNKISSTGMVGLSEALEQNSTLLNLDLSSNNGIGVEGATSLAKALSNNSTLEELKLWSCSVRDDGAKALSQSLVHNSSLKILVIEDNSISNTGAAAIAEALTRNSTLLHLNLSHNSIGDEGLKSLSEVLTYNSTLEELNLSWCEISDEGAMALPEALYMNSSLKVLNLVGNRDIRQKAREALVTATNHQSIRLRI